MKKLTDSQEKFIDFLFTNQNDSLKYEAIFISGIKESGKSECANLILEKLYSKISIDFELLQNKFYFIDFFNDSANATAFFNKIRTTELNKSVIILDNSNEADVSIISKIEKIIQSHNCCLVLIEENSDFFKQVFCSKTQNFISFDKKITDADSILCKSLKKQKQLSILQKRILYACNYYYRNYNIFTWKSISNSLILTRSQFIKGKKFIKKLLKKGILEYFPINTNYIKFVNVSDSNYIIDSKLNNDDLFDTTNYHLFSNEKNSEVKWISLLDLSIQKIQTIDKKERLVLFNKAISFGNYSKLLKVLENYATFDEKIKLFSYELGVLYYNNGRFDEALKCFEKTSDIDETELYLRLIAVMHGSKEPVVQKKIKDYLSHLQNTNSLYGEYWDIHINSEKGKICLKLLEKLDNLRLKLSYISQNSISEFIFERCITDELRLLWILGNEEKSLFKKVSESYENFFSKKKSYQYYNSLYFKAGMLHYYTIPFEIWLKNDFENLEKKLNDAVNYYNDAIDSSFENNKSKIAAKAKRYDLGLMCNIYKEYLNDIITFKNNAIKQKIDVFIAFSDCLLAKGEILKIMTCERLTPQTNDVYKIKTKLDASTKIYEAYKNKYGIARNTFIMLLFEILMNFKSDIDIKYNDSWVKLIEYRKICYPLEAKFIDKLLRYNDIRYIDIMNSLKYYPIILQ